MTRRLALMIATAALPMAMVACDDDNDGNIDAPETPDSVDLDPGEGSGLPGDEGDD